MSTRPRRLAAVVLSLALGLPLVGRAGAGDDPLPAMKARLEVEAQRVEKEFKAEREAVYKMVRSDPDTYAKAVDRIQKVLTTLRADVSLKPHRRATLIETLKWDIGHLKTVAAEKKRVAARDDTPARVARPVTPRADDERGAGAKKVTSEAESILEKRGKVVADARGARAKTGDGFTRTLRSVEESAVPESRDYALPRDWATKSMLRSTAVKLTEKEKAILKALDSAVTADFKDQSFSDVISALEKATGLTIYLDKTGMDDAGVKYDTPVTLKLRASTRTVLKKLLAELNLTYVIKDQMIQVTSIARANETVTTRTYYVGDLAEVVDVRFGPALTKLQAIENLQRIVALITQTVDPQSWKVNNPEAPGSITYDPIRMVLIVKATAEVHYSIGRYK